MKICCSLIKVLSIVCIVSGLTTTARADYVRPTTSDGSAPQGVTISTAPRYFQPVNPSAPRSSSNTTGTRSGCSSDENGMPPQILAPSSFVGLTAAARPTLTWYLPDGEPVPVKLNVYSLGAEDSYEHKHGQPLVYVPGINQYQLPIALEPGTRYLWELILECKPNRPSADLIYDAEIEFVPMVDNSGQTLEMAVTMVEKAEAFARADYWYDAISVLGTGQEPGVLEMRAALLNDLALLEDSAN